MELAQELFLTAAIAVLFSFLIAKLVSIAMVSGGDHSSEDPKKWVDQEVVTEETIMEELSFGGERLQASVFSGEERVEFAVENQERVDQVVSDPVRFQVERSELECGELDDGSVEGKGLVYGELGLEGRREMSGCDILVEHFDQEVLNEDVKFESFTEKSIAEAVKLGSLIEKRCQNDLKYESLSAKSGEEDETPIGAVGEGESNDKVEVETETLVSSDDGWEGIERSELEKVFSKAVKFVQTASDGDSKASVGSDPNLELYGLHKVATEGPCREQPPISLMVSARTKWYQTFLLA